MNLQKRDGQSGLDHGLYYLPSNFLRRNSQVHVKNNSNLLREDYISVSRLANQKSRPSGSYPPAGGHQFESGPRYYSRSASWRIGFFVLV
ncbi:MAG TPA: hypothetical protein VN040_01470 [Pseudosphingobacterium sp.]|nr:hypothetical protein [Pseudosphingobacterium sp.]